MSIIIMGIFLIFIVLIPIIPAWLLFKNLPGDAAVKGPFIKGLKINIQGAFAGYFVVFLVLIVLVETSILPVYNAYYNQKTGQLTGQCYEYWNVRGEVKLSDGQELDVNKLQISIEPPTPNRLKSGVFYMQGVQFPIKEKELTYLIIEYPDYESSGLISLYDRTKVDIIPVSDSTMRIKGQIIIKPITLEKKIKQPVDELTHGEARPLGGNQ